MSFSPKKKKEVQKALQNPSLQKALEKASDQHFEKFNSTKSEIPWETIKKKAQSIREDCLPRLPQLIQKFREEAEKAGAQTCQVSTPEEALAQVEKILREKKANLVVKAKSMVSEEIQLNKFLEKKGYRVVESDLGERIVQLAGERPSHITAPALHKTKEEIAELFSRHFQTHIPPDSKEIVQQARQEMRKIFMEADVGITGANFAVAESGTLVLVSNEGNARLASSLPPVHIALISAEKFVETLEQAASLVKALVFGSSGYKLTAYVSFITGPSRTTDVEKELVIGAHGPKELHILILDNGRLDAIQDKTLNKTLYCLKCGGCMLVCPVFQVLGGHVFGGPVYPGGIGVLLTGLTRSLKECFPLVDYCSDCRKCEEFCPVGIPIGELLLHLKHKSGPKVWEKAVSSLFIHPSCFKTGAKILFFLQRPWKKTGSFRNFPLPWMKGKSTPLLNLRKSRIPEGRSGKKVYLFEGCLGRLFFPEIREAAAQSLSLCGFQVVIPSDQVCCGAPSLHLGVQKDVAQLASQNIESIDRENPDYILTICPTGNAMLKKTYPQIQAGFSRWKDQIFDFSEFLTKNRLVSKRRSLLPSKDLFYHSPCHLRNDPDLREYPKKVIDSLGLNAHEEEGSHLCCGFCGIFSLKNSQISHHLWNKKKEKILKMGIPLIATDCPGCLFQLKSGLTEEAPEFDIVHTAVLVARSLKARENGADESAVLGSI